MKNYQRVAVVLLLCIVLLLLMPEVLAQPQSPSDHPVDIVIVIDDSGSMAGCVYPSCNRANATDPNDLRYSAARLLVQLADDNDRITLVKFSEGATAAVGDWRPNESSGRREELMRAMVAPSDEEYLETHQYTEIDEAFEEVSRLLNTRSNSANPGYVLFLTDGAPTSSEKPPRDQSGSVKGSVELLRGTGVEVYPVVLCGKKIDGQCSGARFVGEYITTNLREAATAGDLLKAFSEIFAEIKPNLQIIPPNPKGDDGRVLTLRTRPSQGLSQLFLITTKDGLRSLTLDDVSQASPDISPDGNISVHLVERSQFPEGRWSAATADERSFFVAKTVTYPKVVFPPPSVAGSVTAPHYYPAGKLPLIVAEVAGPAGGERLQYIELNATQRVSQYEPPDAAGALEALNPQRTRFWNLSSGAVERFALEVGQGTGPLRIIRHFQVRGLDALPRAAVTEPAEGRCDADQPCSLRVGFAPGPEAQDVSAVAYVADEAGTPLFELPMNCTGRECSTVGQQFSPQAGRAYTIRYLVSARSGGGVIFGDWAEEPLTMDPRIKISGLPLEIDLCSSQENAWDVKVIADTTEDLGQFRTNLALKRSDTDEPVAEATVSFGVDINGRAQPPPTTLRIRGAEDLPPGIYEGTLAFSTERAPIGQSVRLPPAIPLFCKKAQPVAKVLDTLVAFPDSPYSASPNSTVEVTSSVRVQFAAEPFDLSLSSFASQSCPELSLVVAGPLEAGGAGYTLPLALTSASRIAPKTCEGTVIFSGPSQDYVVEPDKPITWRLKIPQPELFIKSKTVEFKGPAGLPGDEAHAEILLTYTGSPPFVLAVRDLQANRSDTLVTLADVQVPPSVAETPVNGQDYRVQFKMTPKSNLLTGLYSGKLTLGIEGLEGIVADQTLDTRFRSPNFFQRHILPPLERFYHMPAPGLCTGPLTLLAFLFVAAGWRVRSTQPDPEPAPEAPDTTTTEIIKPPRPPKPPQPSARQGPRPGVRPPAPPPKGRTSTSPPRPPRPPAGRPGSQSASRAGMSSARKPIPPSVPRPSGGAKTTAVSPSPARSTSRPPSPPKGKFPGR